MPAFFRSPCFRAFFRSFCLPFLLLTVVSGFLSSWLYLLPGTAGFLPAAAGPVLPETGEELSASSLLPLSLDFAEARLLVVRHYAGSWEETRLCEASITGMLHSLDPHSRLISPTANDPVETDMVYFGIGAWLVEYGGKVYFRSPMAGSPAACSPLRYGDEIIAIDGQSIAGESLSQVVARLRGPLGTAVTISALRSGQAAPIQARIFRRRIVLPSVTNVFLLTPETGYLAIQNGFTETSAAEVERAVQQLKARGARYLVLDERDNPGGTIASVRDVTGLFLRRGQKIATLQGRLFSDRDRELTATTSQFETMPLVVLINRNTASAGEILAGALQDHDRALLVGEKTFGKGLVQTHYHLPERYRLALTSARYYTPSGRLIQRPYTPMHYYAYHTSRFSRDQFPGVLSSLRYFTDRKRVVFGGDGITPDVEITGTGLPLETETLSELVFCFSRQLLTGQVAGWEDYREVLELAPGLAPGYIISEDDFPVSSSLLSAFYQFVRPLLPDRRLTVNDLTRHEDFIRLHLRHEILTAVYGMETAEQILIRADPLVQQALVQMPLACQLVNGRCRPVSSPELRKSTRRAASPQ